MTTKSVGLFGVAVLAVTITSFGALAADMAVPYAKAPLPPAPVYNWTGCYIGANGGGIGEHDGFIGSWAAGALLGGQFGCNYQMSNFVIGVDGTADWSSSKDSTLTGLAPATTTTATNNFEADIGVRAGIAYDRLFVFGKVGAAWLGYKFNTTIPGAFASTTTASVVVPGVLLGWGLEYGITPHWTGRIETDFVISNNTNVTETCGGVGCFAPTMTVPIQAYALISKIGFSYKF